MQTFDEQLDATGLICPEPLMLARNRVREMNSGQVLLIEATDPSTDRDFENFCRFMKHTLLAKEVTAAEGTQNRLYRYWIRKG
ncbi:MAG: sulfurtransferase TusA [Proteobacteria bacterium]|nr:sulfurtransferase TusA [Pseudomonadota bacterium]